MKVGGKNQLKAIAFGHMAMELRQLGWPVLSGATVGKKVKRSKDSHVNIRMEALIETRPIDNSILEDEIEEVEDAASGEENAGEFSGSAPEEMPIAFRSEVSPNFNRREIVEALVQTTPLANDNAQKQKAEFKTALLAMKEKYRLGMLEERKVALEEEMKARLAKETLDRENAKKARLDKKYNDL
ncbi:hypothetical protein R1flu_007365 [Riccia fluitans]|uniref:Uncharacterized protein n=1 Tax=Riccia fluitans TaxID=41844 RepID=A0ABD1YZ74_9MARC